MPAFTQEARRAQSHSRWNRALDKAFGVNRIGDNSVCMERICSHTRTQVIARRDGVDYLECLDCRQIFEAEDLEAVPVYDEEEQSS